MTGSVRFLAGAATAGRVAADRAELWLPGALGAVGYLAWLPLLLTVAVPPRASDLAFLGADFFSSGLFPLNVLLVATLGTLAVLVGCVIAAFAEAVLLRAAGRGTPNRSLVVEMEAILSVMLVAVLPAIAAAAAVASATAAVAPTEFMAPDTGAPFMWRVAGRVLPLVVALAVLIVVGQAFGAVAIRRAAGPAAIPVSAALRAGLRDLVRRPVRRLGLASASFAADLLALALSVALLRVLWAPIQAEIAGGQLLSPQALLLLVGFVAIWLVLVMAFGALHAWVSAWWSLELAEVTARAGPEAQEARR